MTPANLTSLISTVVTPVALITPTAILLGNYSAKYTAIASQMRLLAGEYRQRDTHDARRTSIKGQLRFFHRRVTALWAASGALLMALLSFLVTVLTLIFLRGLERLTVIGGASIVFGLLFILVAVILELYEIGLARLTTAGDLSDVFTPDRETKNIPPEFDAEARRGK